MAETLARRAWPATEETLGPWPVNDDVDGIAPRGIIYHVSKCGSTLVSQLLKRCGGVAVYSQPPAINDLLLPPHPGTPDDMIALLRALGARLSRHAGGSYVLKLESWNVLFCDLIQRAFPQTPWVFCIRDPVDVAVSVMEDPDPVVWYRLRGCRDNPFMDLLGITPDASSCPGHYIALIYAAFCRAILQLDPSRGSIIAYDTMPRSIWTVAAPAFGIALTPQQRAMLQQAAAFYSKEAPGSQRRFVSDSLDKRARAAIELRAVIERWARPAYEEVLAAACVGAERAVSIAE
ncbi:hypothetical protein ACQR1I_24290 [Bradyrhizobium sp. HKCCYLS2038]|uniref:hypothetical protein n=1 Tax=unclassified Bradyrhizobium TaxID=2631580 RepID=UPI003EBA4D59